MSPTIDPDNPEWGEDIEMEFSLDLGWTPVISLFDDWGEPTNRAPQMGH